MNTKLNKFNRNGYNVMLASNVVLAIGIIIAGSLILSLYNKGKNKEIKSQDELDDYINSFSSILIISGVLVLLLMLIGLLLHINLN